MKDYKKKNEIKKVVNEIPMLQNSVSMLHTGSKCFVHSCLCKDKMLPVFFLYFRQTQWNCVIKSCCANSVWKEYHITSYQSFVLQLYYILVNHKQNQRAHTVPRAHESV